MLSSLAMCKPAVFLDRDGTINEQVGYVNHLDRFWLLPGAAEAIQLLNQRNIPVIVVTNQAGAARGYFAEELVAKVHQKMHALLAAENAHLDGIYYCPHLKGGTIPHLDIDCDCRKPKTGMLLRAAAEHDVALKDSFMVGDRLSDVAFGQAVGARGILVRTGYGKGELDLPSSITPDFVADDLPAAVRWILSSLGQPVTSHD